MEAVFLRDATSDFLGDSEDAAEIQVAFFFGSGAYTNEADFRLKNGRFGIGRRGDGPLQAFDFDDPFQTFLNNGRLAPIDQINLFLADIDANNHMAILGQARKAHISDISQAKDADPQFILRARPGPFSEI